MALVVVSLFVSFIANFLGLNDLQKVSDRITQIHAFSPFLIAYFLIVRVFAEEIFFRGFLVKYAGWFFSSVLFGLAHFAYGSIAEVLGAFVLGLLLAKAFEKNKNILPNFLAHFFYNLIFLVTIL